jgi:hypothetical protein
MEQPEGYLPLNEDGSEFCTGGKHYMKDSSANKMVELGDCPEPKHQVLQAAQQAQQAASGEPQKGLVLQSQLPANAEGNPYKNNPMAKSISDYFNGK